MKSVWDEFIHNLMNMTLTIILGIVISIGLGPVFGYSWMFGLYIGVVAGIILSVAAWIVAFITGKRSRVGGFLWFVFVALILLACRWTVGN